MCANATVSDTPDPQRRLEWPGKPRGFDEDEEADEILDPGGNWLPDSEHSASPSELLVLDSLFRDDRRWAPQHGVEGRSDSALPGAFLFPEPAAPASAPEVVPGYTDSDAGAELKKGRRTTTFLREAVETGLLAILVFLSVRASVQHYRVEGQSMAPTLASGEFLLVNSLVYSEVDLQKFADFVPFWDPGPPDVRQVFHGPERGDIVILHPRQRYDQNDLVKRIVGLPGDRFEIREGVVVVNGRELIEPYIEVEWRGSMPPITIPADHYFVMGDNRNNSQDSRAFGPVNEDDIVGKAMVSWWPRSTWGLAPNEEPSFGEPIER